jgi:triacylglycerol esterase/lipase EstA (alpha/beta hydrolase family)
MRKPILALVAAVLASAALASSAQAQLPVIYNGLLGYAHVSSSESPPGANNWACKPSKTHPRPVVLVHGTFIDMSASWQALSPLLVNEGYCVFALNYGSSNGSGALGIYATGSIPASAEELSAFVDRVLNATHTKQVDIVGHSQGGMMPRYYMKFLGGASKVHTLIGLAPSNHGTTVDGLFIIAEHIPGATSFLGFCQACEEQASGSPFIANLNAGGDTLPGVHYTVIESANDEVVTPYQSAFLKGSHVTNITLQAQCVLDQGEHLSMPYDHIADADVLTALDPADPQHPACTPVLPIAGG